MIKILSTQERVMSNNAYIVSAVRRLVYFDKILFKKTKTEINLLTRIFTKRK